MANAKGLKRVSDFLPSLYIEAYNYTGADTVIGQVAALNMDAVFTNVGANAAITGGVAYVPTVDGTPTTDIRGTAVPVTTLNALLRLCVAQSVIASGKIGRWLVEGVGQVQTSGTIVVGDFLWATNAQIYVTPTTGQAGLDALAVPTGIIGTAMTARSGAGLITAELDCAAWKHLIGGGG